MSGDLSFWQPLDVDDLGEAVSFFAVQMSEPTKWSYRYTVTLASTHRFGSQGRLGDGDDISLEEGILDVPWRVLDDGSIEDYLEEYAYENLPEIPDEVRQEYIDDLDLLEMSETGRPASWNEDAFSQAYFEVVGIEDPDDYDYRRAGEVFEYAKANGWSM